jgi:hypothetical protein
MPLPFRPLELVLEKIARLYHDFMLDFKHNFYFSRELLFALSRFVFFTNFYFLPSRLFVPCTILYFFAVFKMGVKNIRTSTLVMFFTDSIFRTE